MSWFLDIAQHPHPVKRIRALSCQQLANAEEELRTMAKPNELQCQVYALVAAEALRRWRMGLASGREVTGHESRVTEEEG